MVTPPTTCCGGGFIPSITNSFVNKACRSNGKLFCKVSRIKGRVNHAQKFLPSFIPLKTLSDKAADLHLIISLDGRKTLRVPHLHLLTPVSDYVRFFQRV